MFALHYAATWEDTPGSATQVGSQIGSHGAVAAQKLCWP